MQLGFLRSLYAQTGEHASVYLDTERIRQDATQAVELRWRAARDRLAAAGAGRATLDAIAQVMADESRSAAGTAAFARNGEVEFTGILPAPPRREIARFAALPHLMPLLAQHPPAIPHVRVSATRAGGEIVAVGGDGSQWRDWIAGKQWPLHKTSVGGWSQGRYQRGVEETWDENAKAVAAEVAAAASAIGAQHVIAAGDIRARSLLLGHLSKALRDSAVVVDEEVAADSKALADAADLALSEWAVHDVRRRFDDWQAGLAHGTAVQGLAATMAALRDGQVSDVFIADDPRSTAPAWIGPGGAQLAVTAEELVDSGVPDPVADRADAALVRAVASTDAELHFLPADLVQLGDADACGGIARPRDGVAATLRFAL